MQNLRTALYDWHVTHKARMVPFAGWDMPVQYTGIIEEHKAVRGGAGIFDISHMARIALDGPDALRLLDAVFTNSVATMKTGQVRYGLICNDVGRILDDILVYRWADDRFHIVVNGSNRIKILDWLKHVQMRIASNAPVVDQTLETVMMAVQGPKAVELVKGMFADDATTLKYYFGMPTTYQGQPCVVSRTGYTGEDGFEVWCAPEPGLKLWNEFVAKGALPCGLGARDTLRLEAAMPLYGHELNEETTPLQAQLSWAVKYDKGDFIGRTALDHAKAGPTVRVGIELEGKRAAREGCGLFAGETQIGSVTSGSFVPHLEKSIAMGYVPPMYAPLGTELLVDVRGTKLPAKVVSMPFYKRKK
jgi:aminomethyltransferase